MIAVAWNGMCVVLACWYGVRALNQGRRRVAVMFALLGAVCLLVATLLLVDMDRRGGLGFPARNPGGERCAVAGIRR